LADFDSDWEISILDIHVFLHAVSRLDAVTARAANPEVDNFSITLGMVRASVDTLNISPVRGEVALPDSPRPARTAIPNSNTTRLKELPMSRILLASLVGISHLGLLGLATADAAALGGAHVAQPERSIDFGFEDGALGETPPRWFVPSAGWAAELTDAKAADGSASLTLVRREETDAPFGNVMRVIDATPYRGRRVVLTARIRAEGPPEGLAMMWLRADLNDGTMGAFDNMQDRPILRADDGDDTWSEAVIELDIEPTARNLALGFMSVGGATLFIDAARLETLGETAEPPTPQAPSEPHPLSPRGLANLEAAARLLSYIRFFHASDQAVSVMAWDHLAVALMEVAEPAPDAKDLAERLGAFFAPIAPTLEIWAGGPESAPPLPEAPEGIERVVSWLHHGAGNFARDGGRSVYSSKVERKRPPAALPWGTRTLDPQTYADAHLVKPLGAGVSCRLPVKVLADREGTLPHAPAETEWSTVDDKGRLTADNRSTRLAGVALAWGVMQHFYPYFDIVDADWDAALSAALASAAQDSDASEYLWTLEELIANLHDGHGYVYNPSLQELQEMMIPLAFAWAGSDLVIAGKHESVGAELALGDIVLEIDARPVAEWYTDFSTRISAATDGWRRWRALEHFAYEIPGAEAAKLRLRHPDGEEYETTLARIPPTRIADATAARPANGEDLAPGIVYFNLDGAEADMLHAAMPKLAGAEGVVFDLRGYPGGAGQQLMAHLSGDWVMSARWNIPIVTLPDREEWGWEKSGRWRLPPAEPRLNGQIAFITDGRAVSYAESVMGIVEAYGLGEIVGATTAGTNGNINPFELPGGYTVIWTGMKVLKHDGSQHHGVGIAPTVPIEPTAKGIAEGRDEVLEKAVEVLQEKIAAGGGG
jgi:hypothetical protein